MKIQSSSMMEFSVLGTSAAFIISVAFLFEDLSIFIESERRKHYIRDQHRRTKGRGSLHWPIKIRIFRPCSLLVNVANAAAQFSSLPHPEKIISSSSKNFVNERYDTSLT